MSIPPDFKINYEIKPTTRTIKIDTPLKDNHSDWIAWWYGGIYKNQKAMSQPNVLIDFREIVNGTITGDAIYRRIPLTSLGQVTVGSIWKDGVCRSGVDFSVEEFDVDFRRDGWQLTTFEHAYQNQTELPYPQKQIYPLKYSGDRNWLIQFKLPTGGKLIVPCLEFFSRCYGRSQEVNRILASYPWEGKENSCLSKFYAPLDEPEERHKWKVKLRKRLVNGDVTFLAHAKYDNYTKKSAKSIYSQIEKLFKPEDKSPMFIQVEPWFQGTAELRVKGIWFDNNRSFLALQIIGGSDPDGILIERDRENSNKREGDDEDASLGVAWAGIPEKKLIRPPDIVDLTGDEEPDHNSGGVALMDQDFVVLGIPRFIVDRHGKKVTNGSGAGRKGDNASAYSSGEPQGSGKKVGFASIHARPVMESQGALRDMWDAILFTQRKYPEKISNVEWFTFEDGFKSLKNPNLIALEPFEECEMKNLPSDTKSWPYFDKDTALVRGVMVVRVIVEGKHVYITEIQRRPRTIKKKGEQEKEGEQSFKGFVTIIEDYNLFSPWLRRFISDIRYVKGIVKKLVSFSPGKADAFTHTPAKNEEVPCEAAVLQALGKVGVKL